MYLSEGLQRKEESVRMVYGRDEGKAQHAVEVDTEDMRKWRGLSQSEKGLCWKNLADRMVG